MMQLEKNHFHSSLISGTMGRMQKNSTINFDILSLFDAVMAEVEPDLMRANIGTLNRKYQDETAGERSSRAERYAEAYLEWKSRLKKIVAAWKKEVMKYRNEVLKGAKMKASEEDTKTMLDIATTIDNL